MARRSTIFIQPVGFAPAVALAAKELESYLPRVAPVSARALPEVPGVPAHSDATIVLGTAEHLKGLGLGRLPHMHELDDALAIIPKRGTLYLTGSNPRSVLFATYRLLEEQGVVFLRPGPNGEVIPRRKSLHYPAKAIREKASYRHRGICIEGHPRLEHALMLLDWMAKKKMNTWHLEFMNAGVYWDRGYQMSPDAAAREFHRRLDARDYDDIDSRTIAAAKERGMAVHRGGHGWTAIVLGYPGTGWYHFAEQGTLAAPRSWIAQVGGKRALSAGQPANTELCYSNSEVRAALSDEVLAYARQHSEADYLHCWISDNFNNNCECEACAKYSPSDWYAVIINEIAARLEAERIRTTLVLNVYLNTLHPPQKVKIEARNVMVNYGPITRCYKHRITDPECGDAFGAERPPLNQLVLPKGNRGAADIARMWKALQLPDSQVFEYYRWEPIWQDGIQLDLAETVYRDMKDYKSLGIRGVMSNDCLRAFYPHPVPANAMADLLWDSSTAPKGHREATMSAAFGAHADTVAQYFSTMIDVFGSDVPCRHDMESLRVPAPSDEQLRTALALAKDARASFRSMVRAEKDRVVKTSLELAALHAEHVSWLSEAFLASRSGNDKALARLRKRYEKWLRTVLEDYGPWVDCKIGEPVQRALRSTAASDD